MRVIGMDIHRTFAEAVMIDGDKLIRLGRVNMSRDHLAAFAAKLTHDDHVIVEATGNAQAVVEAVAPFVQGWFTLVSRCSIPCPSHTRSKMCRLSQTSCLRAVNWTP